MPSLGTVEGLVGGRGGGDGGRAGEPEAAIGRTQTKLRGGAGWEAGHGERSEHQDEPSGVHESPSHA